MSKDEQPLKREDVEKALTDDNARRPFQEYPKMLHHPDGSQRIVNSDAEEKSAGSEWQQTPQEALDLKAAREEMERKQHAAAVKKAVDEKNAKK